MNTGLTLEELDYLEFFGLNNNPFPVAPDNEHFYISDNIDQVLTEVLHGIISRKGFMVITGEVGLGKTTMSRRIISILEEKGIESSLVFHTSYQDVELLREINRDFGIEEKSLLFGDHMKRLNDFLLEKNLQGKNCTIIIDDAQNLDNRSLELVRMISNLEADRRKLVQILLIGQSELVEKLDSPELRQLKSRILIKKEVYPLTRQEIKNYLQFKLNLAGSSGQVNIDHRAIKKIHRLTHGNLRKVNIIMDRCLYVAFYYNTKNINTKIVTEAYADIFPARLIPVKKIIAPAATVVFLFSIVLYGIYINDYFNSPFQHSVFAKKENPMPPEAYSAPEQSDSDVKKQVPVLDEFYETVIDRPVDFQENIKDSKSLSIPKFLSPVNDFLSAYNLSAYNEKFHHALNTDGFNDVAEEIFVNTGYQLVRLNTVPEFIKNRYGVLAYQTAFGDGEEYYLFWKPGVKLDRFRYAYQSEDILQIQKMLARSQFYYNQLDGVVGKYFIQAVKDFQKMVSLPQTGYPDETTIFYLCHEEVNFPK